MSCITEYEIYSQKFHAFLVLVFLVAFFPSLQIKRPTSSRFIRFYSEDGDDLVYTIDVTSPDVTFPEQCTTCEGRTLTFNRTLTFTNINYAFMPGQTYYILIDGGKCRVEMLLKYELYEEGMLTLLSKPF